MNPLFSIITVCYNSEKTIERTIQSVLNQSFDNYEYIIIDGKSTDRTLEIIKQYIPLFNNKLRVVSESDVGIYDAMNKGIRLSKGKLIGILNSDDYYESDALENILTEYHDEPYTVVYGMLRAMKNGKELLVYMNNANFMEEGMIPHPTSFVSRKIYEEYGTYNLKYRYSADYEFMVRIARTDKVRFIPVYKVITCFTIGGISSSADALIDTLQVKLEYGIIDKKNYKNQLARIKINDLKRRFRERNIK